MIPITDILPASSAPSVAAVRLTYDQRLVRRKVLVAEDGAELMIDLPQIRGLNHGERLITEKGAYEVVAAEEDLLEITGPDLIRLAWHIGNRHAPCQIEPTRLRIQYDPVLADMAARLGAEIQRLQAPFQPEGGAYGHGRTFGHAHGDHHHAHD